MRILYVTAEIYPLVKTGGLGDITAALPPALIEQGLDVRLLLPGLPAIMEGLLDLQRVSTIGPAFGAETVTLLLGRVPESNVPAYVIDAPQRYGRSGNPYLAADGQDWPDNHLRFALLSWAAARLGNGEFDRGWRPDIIHGHDWHAGLMPAYVAASVGPRPATVFTIHNLAYQGLFPALIYPELGLPTAFFAAVGLEYYGQVSFMKAGLVYADCVTTVSPTYADEISHPGAGCGLEGVIAARAGAIEGILNGVDYQVWDPASDERLTKNYTRDDLRGKGACKAALQREMGLAPRPDALLFGMVSRLVPQKGLDLVLGALPEITRRGGQLALLGSGELALEQAFAAAATANPHAVAVVLGYDDALSHRIVAGADVIPVPSRFEPCGLTQLYGLRYGTLPLVHRVGGLADTVNGTSESSLLDGSATGFVFDEASVDGVLGAASRAFAAYQNAGLWTQLKRNAMARNFSWREAAKHYAALYLAVCRT